MVRRHPRPACPCAASTLAKLASASSMDEHRFDGFFYMQVTTIIHGPGATRSPFVRTPGSAHRIAFQAVSSRAPKAPMLLHAHPRTFALFRRLNAHCAAMEAAAADPYTADRDKRRRQPEFADATSRKQRDKNERAPQRTRERRASRRLDCADVLLLRPNRRVAERVTSRWYR